MHGAKKIKQVKISNFKSILHEQVFIKEPKRKIYQKYLHKAKINKIKHTKYQLSESNEILCV